MKINLGIISSEEKDLITEIKKTHKMENVLWKIPNLVIPIFTVFLSLLCYLAFSDKRGLAINYVNLVINGSLPLIAINLLSSNGAYIFKFDKSTEKRLAKDTRYLRTKLFLFLVFFLIINVILFAFQVINHPFSNWYLLLCMVLLSIFLIWFSSYISRRIYLLQEQFIENTFDSEIREEAKNKHGNNW